MRNGLLSLLLAMTTGLLAANTLPEVRVVQVSDLRADAAISSQKKLPILIAFTASHCSYCEVVKESFLKPMLRNKRYGEKVLIREVMIDSFADIRDFEGAKLSTMEFASQYRATLTPTLVFLGPNGEELSKRLVGVTTVDYYGGFIDQGIDEALQRLGNFPPGQTTP